MRALACIRGLSRAGPRGFTLVELLCVVAILAVLAGILFPVFGQVRERARRISCLSNLQQLAKAQQLYLQDWDERFTAWSLPALSGPSRFWTDLFEPYLRTRAVFRDPSAVWQGSTPEEGVPLADYALLTWGPDGRGTRQDPYWRWPGPPLSLARVLRPTETISLLDGWTTPNGARARILRHTGGVNAGFLDGHARWLTKEESARMDTDGHGFYWMHYAAVDR